ncbi:hypothetical protein HNQ59_002911 [Chitinivorax tropicus]|uniref:SnoaL-like domain-containing protein n=1 Tax=Chitinivorax tropicus TaxID=714531 RepID=A0A840MR94_9PROT|nr:nuclear transport factor 2 family protein [Chitinivorax tropicus]MBB5019609.1 hypothetical protein [Chitinivorax tropicus]
MIDRIVMFWQAIQARNWETMRACLHEDATLSWWASGEHFSGGDAIVHVNRIYPEGWSITLHEINPLPDGRVHSLVRVDHPGQGVFFANSFFTLRAGKIQHADEYWSDCVAPPAWRSEGALPGYRQEGERRPPVRP